MQTIEDILKAIKEKNMNVSEISRNTGIPGTRIYKWLENNGKPKGDDSVTLHKWAVRFLDKVPNQPSGEGFGDAGSITDKTLHILSRLMEAQHLILSDIRMNMARQDSQAMIMDTVKRIDANLTETLAGVEFVSKMQLRKILDRLPGQEVHAESPLVGVRRKRGDTDEDGHTSGKSPGKGR